MIMVNMKGAEKGEFKKAYIELNEIIKKMSTEEKQKIPRIFMQNLHKEMDTNYKFIIDNKKSILEQDLKTETKALLVELYEKYLAPKEEKEFWKKYDSICLNMIENNKKEKYDPNKIFSNKNLGVTNNDKKNISEKLPIEIKENNLFTKVIEIVKKIFHIH